MMLYTSMYVVYFYQNVSIFIAPDKRWYPDSIFLISAQKHMLWVLIRSAQYDYQYFLVEKSALPGAMDLFLISDGNVCCGYSLEMPLCTLHTVCSGISV